MLLGKMRDIAENYIGEKIEAAIVTATKGLLFYNSASELKTDYLSTQVIQRLLKAGQDFRWLQRRSGRNSNSQRA